MNILNKEIPNKLFITWNFYLFEFVMMVDIRETKIWEEDYNKYRELESKGMALVHGSRNKLS